MSTLPEALRWCHILEARLDASATELTRKESEMQKGILINPSERNQEAIQAIEWVAKEMGMSKSQAAVLLIRRGMASLKPSEFLGQDGRNEHESTDK